MTDMEPIKTAFERHVQTLMLRPAIGQKTYSTKIRVHNGLTCKIADGPWHLTADLTTKCGGNEAGPTPGTCGRAALGSCVAMSDVMWATRARFQISGQRVQ